ncbi:uncharacterized protein LOC119668150 isoform X2 [Teleopsis dalmanni]|uniref:uncharacterized protein LOC119668150 isoform X2 n=1 Tax=Teleopsis dalmanni TaxID=139649 RepID=UPI0018CF6706|nr:uncharacterized protein LOC119668150 isoform X2 [Teleopsis dalmanni]
MDNEDAKEKEKMHHPWDEVSLPGADTNESNQPTILLLNKVNEVKETIDSASVATKKSATEAHTESPQIEDQRSDEVATNAQTAELPKRKAKVKLQRKKKQIPSDNLVNNSDTKSETSCDTINSPPSSPLPSASVAESAPLYDRQFSREHVLDIESHLIETYDDYQAKDESVGIKELQPIQDELTLGSSKVETDHNLCTVIEVEPAGVKIKKPIKTRIQAVQAQIIEDIGIEADIGIESEDNNIITDQINSTANDLIDEILDIAKESIKVPNIIEEKVILVENTKQSNEENSNAEELKNASEDLNKIVSEVRSTSEDLLNGIIDAAESIAQQKVESAAAELVDKVVEIAETRTNEEDSVVENVDVDEAIETVDTRIPKADSVVENAENIEKVLVNGNVDPVELSIEIEDKSDSLIKRTTVAFELTEEANDEIKRTAELLISEIEREALNAISQQLAENKTGSPLNEVKEADYKNKHKLKLENSADDPNDTLSQKVDEHISEITGILKKNTRHEDILLNGDINNENLNINIIETQKALKIIDVPTPKNESEVEARKLFIESLPQIDTKTDAEKLAEDCKREYYQSLKKYLIQSSTEKPPVPLQTYKWEDLRRAKERGGYPWTHLYKRPLGPDEEPEIVLLLRKSQELRFTSESPKSLKKVRIDEQVLVKEAERYIQDLSEDEEDDQKHQTLTEDDEENHSIHSESISCVSDSVLAVGKPRKSNRLNKIRGILKRRKSGRSSEDAQSLPGTSTNTSRRQSEEHIEAEPLTSNENTPQHKEKRCYPIMKKLKSMADRQKKRLNIKRITLRKDEKIVLGEETKILKLKKSPKSDRGEIPHFIEKQDSDDVLEIVELDESPSRKHRPDNRDVDSGNDVAQHAENNTTIVQPDEIIEIETTSDKPESKKSEVVMIDITDASETKVETETDAEATRPRKAPRLRREHVYEEIDQPETIESQLNDILELASVEALKKSLVNQDNSALEDIANANKPLPLDRMGSSEEENFNVSTEEKPSLSLLAPISSIDSTSSEEDKERAKSQLSPVAEESDVGSVDGQLNEPDPVDIVEKNDQIEIKSSIKKEASPAPSDKKVTFSHVEDEAEPHREDIELPSEIMEATAARKLKTTNDHEYEPIGVPVNGEKPVIKKESSPAPVQAQNKSKIKMEIDTVRDEMKAAEDLQRDFEEQYFSSATTTPRTESRTDNEIHTSQVDTSALEELPLKPENRKKGFMASAQDRTRKMQAGLKSQAGKLKTKLRSPAKKPPAGSPKAKDRKRFKAPEFSKIKMPEIKRPDMSKLKELKRPEFTKFNKPDMSKFKLPEKFSTLKLRRSKSLKENETSPEDEISGITTEAPSSKVQESQPQKKIFEFNFGTYPRAFRKKKKPVEPEPLLDAGTGTGTGTEGLSVITSTETQPSVESSSSPQGDRGPGPVRSRWADKFSDVSYNDSEGSRYRRYGSEQESFDRESSLERRMREDLEDTGSEAPMELGILGGVADNKQFAEFDEENRAIHEISNLRAGEFKRRPMVHQDSDLRSEDSKEAVGWTDKEIQKNKLLRHAELEAEASYLKYSYDDGIAQETHSTASSGKKVVMEEIDDDEFFLRKRGISQDNIELRQYITNAIREGYDTPINALQHVGQSSERMEFGEYDVPPPKPRRLHKSNRPEDISQEFETQRSDYGDDLSMSQNGSDFLTGPKRPMRKERSRSKYSMDSQDVAMPDDSIRHARYFDDDEEYLRPPRSAHYRENNFDIADKQVFTAEDNEVDSVMQQPQAPQRKRRQLRDVSMDKDSYINGFSGRSVSNNYLQEPEDVIVYRTEHEYPIPPLATPENYTDGNSIPSRKSRSTSRFDEDDRTSRGADSLTLDANMRIDNDIDAQDVDEKFIIDMIESDGYAVVRKEQLPKPTPPARRKKFSRSPGERFATMPNMRTKHGTPPPERPPPPREYTPSTDLPTKPVYTTDVAQNYEDDYEEPGISANERPESPRDLQSGDVINKMKYRPLPPPPRPPRDKRNRAESRASNQGSRTDEHESTMLDIDENIATSSTADSYDQNMESDDNSHIPEVEVSTQTDPLPDDFICEEFEITEDMKVIAPRRSGKTLDELMKEHLESETNEPKLLTEDEQLAIGLQRFRDANQRSLSERSRASSQADRSRSLSRPQTPSAVIIERRVSTPIPSQQNESVLEAALIVRPVDDLDLEEEALRREGLLTDSSQQSKSDVESHYQAEADNTEEAKGALSDYSYAPSSSDLDAAIEKLRLHEEELSETQHVEEEDAEIERTMRDYSYDDDEAERYSNHYDEDESELTTENVTAKNELLRLQELLEKTTLDALNKTEKSDISEDDNEFTAAEKELLKRIERIEQMDTESSSAVAPLPPPRRKSTTAIETTNDLIIAEQIPTQLTPVQAVVNREQLPQSQLPSRLGDLEVDHLRVHALQAGQIMVSQLHGTEISADELECKSGSLVVKNIELPPGFIEDIVERVRNTERSQLLNTETQTSLQASNEEIPTEQVSQLPVSEIVPPPKPPRLRNLESTPASTTYTADIQHDITQQNLDEETQTDIPAAPQLPPIVFPTAEYLQSIAPLALYNLRQQTEMDPIDDTTASTKCQHRSRHHHHHHHRRRDSTSSDIEEEPSDIDEPQIQRRHRSRSTTRPRDRQSIAAATKQLLGACSLQVVNIVNHLTEIVRGEGGKEQDIITRLRQVPVLVALFIVVTFGVLLYLLSGKNVHTHHWDYFNPPGNDGRHQT